MTIHWKHCIFTDNVIVLEGRSSVAKLSMSVGEPSTIGPAPTHLNGDPTVNHCEANGCSLVGGVVQKGNIKPSLRASWTQRIIRKFQGHTQLQSFAAFHLDHSTRVCTRYQCLLSAGAQVHWAHDAVCFMASFAFISFLFFCEWLTLTHQKGASTKSQPCCLPKHLVPRHATGKHGKEIWHDLALTWSMVPELYPSDMCASVE